MLKAIFVAAVLSLATTADAQWTLNPSNKHLYRLNPVKLTWKMAEAQAVTLGGHLVTVRSQAEQLWLDSKFGPIYWIGLTDERVHNSWEWVSGEPVTYTKWCTGPLGPGYDYLRTHQSTTVCWVADNAKALYPSIIEFAPKADFSVFGRGCASTTSLPTITSTSTPKVGQQFSTDISGFLPKLQFGQFILGTSNTNWGFIQLPWDLTILGMSGCNLLVSLDVSGVIATNSQGSASVSFPIPLDPRVYGVTFYGQAWMADSTANALGVATTNAFKARIGL